MRVYIVMGSVKYEGAWLVDVYTSELYAEEVVRHLQRKKENERVEFYLVKKELK